MFQKSKLKKNLIKIEKLDFLEKSFFDETNELINEQQKLTVKKAKYAYELKQNDKKFKKMNEKNSYSIYILLYILIKFLIIIFD